MSRNVKIVLVVVLLAVAVGLIAYNLVGGGGTKPGGPVAGTGVELSDEEEPRQVGGPQMSGDFDDNGN